MRAVCWVLAGAALALGCERRPPPGDDGVASRLVVAPGAPKLEPFTLKLGRDEEPINIDLPIPFKNAWWEDEVPCPVGTRLVGAAPPAASLVRCETTNGVRHGRLTSFAFDDTRMVDTHYDHGREHGEETAYHPNGRVAHEGHYWEGERTGPWVGWHASGEKAWAGAYLIGRKEGYWAAWYDSGYPRSKGRYKGNLKHGKWTEYYADGKVKVAGQYDLDRPYGEFTHHRPDGSIERVEKHLPKSNRPVSASAGRAAPAPSTASVSPTASGGPS